MLQACFRKRRSGDRTGTPKSQAAKRRRILKSFADDTSDGDDDEEEDNSGEASRFQMTFLYRVTLVVWHLHSIRSSHTCPKS